MRQRPAQSIPADRPDRPVPPARPFGLEPLGRLPQGVFWVAAAVGAGVLIASPGLEGASRGLALLGGVGLLDFGQAGLRAGLWARLRGQARWIAVGLVLLALATALVHLGSQWAEKRRVLADSGGTVWLRIRETTGLARQGYPVVVALAGTAKTVDRLAVYEGTTRLRSSYRVDPRQPMLVVLVDLDAHQTKDLEVAFSATEPETADPEESWPLQDAYAKGMLQTAATLQRSSELGFPWLGRSFLRIQAAPAPLLPDVFVSWGLPLPPIQPGVLTELVYAVRTATPCNLAGSVQIETDQGPLWQQDPVDQEGQPVGPWAGLGEGPTGRWHWRRISLSRLQGSHIQDVRLHVALPEGQPALPCALEFDAMGWAQGPPPEASWLN